MSPESPVKSLCQNPMWENPLEIGQVCTAKHQLIQLINQKNPLSETDRQLLIAFKEKIKSKRVQLVDKNEPLCRELNEVKRAARKLLKPSPSPSPIAVTAGALSLSQKQLPKFPLLDPYTKISPGRAALIEQHKITLEELLKKNTSLSANEFYDICHQECEKAKEICELELTKENGFGLTIVAGPAKNRYSDTLPYHFNFIGENQESYVNASLITFKNKQFIAAQAPVLTYNKHNEVKYDTISDFLYLLETGANTIVTLTMPQEKEHTKCPEWWLGKRRQLKAQCWFEAVKEEDILAHSSGQGLVKRTFHFTNNGIKREITQFHFINWLDGKVPDLEVLEELIKLLTQHSSTGPLIVHCSAGVGRTGTFILAHMLYLSIKEQLAKSTPPSQIELNVLKDVITLRTQRMKMVGTSHQWHAVVQLICRLVK